MSKLRTPPTIPLCVTLLLLTAVAVKAETPLAVLAHQRQLFLDDFVVAEMHGLSRVMHQPEKRGAVLKPEGALDGEFIQSRSAPMWDPDRQQWVLVYIACTVDRPQWIGPALALSEDGIHWNRPVLDAVEIAGTTNNNRFQPGTDATWPHNALDGVIVSIPRQSRGLYVVSRSKRLCGALTRTRIWSHLSVARYFGNSS